jgi:hypothetical protein
VIGFGILGVFTAIFFTGPRLYHGRTVMEWVARLDPIDPIEYARARTVLLEIGPEAMPDLGFILAQNTGYASQAKQFVYKLIGRMRLKQPPRSVSLETLQGHACMAAALLAESNHVDISSLVPVLERHLLNGTYASNLGARALGSSGSEGVAILTHLLQSPKMSIRYSAAYGLSFARGNPAVTTLLFDIVRAEPDPILRANALQYVDRSAGTEPVLVPLAISFLSGSNLFTRYSGALVLSNFPNNTNAVRALSEYRAREFVIPSNDLLPKNVPPNRPSIH